ncbi:regulatory protein RecX [Pseudoramibacter faecis]|uniref:regulatory protein RecX n=1 Tax=Pseudoramibacter faecis TaxID=3108534 RepID=UPI003CC9A7EE
MGQKFIVDDQGKVSRIANNAPETKQRKNNQRRLAFDVAMDYLSYRDRTEQEMAEYLGKKNYTAKEIAACMAELKSYGYVDDQAYIARVCEENQLYKHFGKSRLRWELKRKGVSEQSLHTLEDYISEDDEMKNALAAFEAANDKYRTVIDAKRKQKIAAWMQRRGFAFETIRPLLAQINREEDQDVDEQNEMDSAKLEQDYAKYYRMQSRKGYHGWELKARIKRNLMSRGHCGAAVQIMMERHTSDGAFDDEQKD